MNNVCLVGRLTRDPETRYGSGDNATAVCRFTLAVQRTFKREGEPECDFINIVSFGKKGEFAGKYFHKGMRVGVTGSIRTGGYENKEGKKVNTFEVYADQVEFADGKADTSQPVQAAQYSQPVQSALPPEDFAPIDTDFDEDMPF